jgi:hypothetical protein
MLDYARTALFNVTVISISFVQKAWDSFCHRENQLFSYDIRMYIAFYQTDIQDKGILACVYTFYCNIFFVEQSKFSTLYACFSEQINACVW